MEFCLRLYVAAVLSHRLLFLHHQVAFLSLPFILLETESDQHSSITPETPLYLFQGFVLYKF